VRLVHVYQLRASPFLRRPCWATHTATTTGRAESPAGSGSAVTCFYQAPLYPYFPRRHLPTDWPQPARGAAHPGPQSGRWSCALLATWRPAILYRQRLELVAGIGLAIYAPAIFLLTDCFRSQCSTSFFLSLSPLADFLLLLDHRDDRRIWLALGLAMGALRPYTRKTRLVFIVVILAWCLVRRDTHRSG